MKWIYYIFMLLCWSVAFYDNAEATFQDSPIKFFVLALSGIVTVIGIAEVLHAIKNKR